MSQGKPKKKKVVVAKKTKKKISPTSSTISSKRTKAVRRTEFTFNRQHFMIMGIGLACIALGFILMAGGAMPDPDVWEPERIYGFRRTVLAPLMILIGLGLQVYAIFKDTKD